MDRNIILWDIASSQLSGVSLLRTSSWPYCFLLTYNNSMWIGTEAAEITHLTTSPDAMAASIRRLIKRNFTIDEWKYYVGSDVPMLHLVD